MKRYQTFGLMLAALGVAAGCGDNSRECGDGTTDVNGVCMAGGGQVVCSAGTKPNAAGTACVVDPNDCQNGTVLIGTQCEDPSGLLTVDVEEGVEPNGLGIGGETSADAAGVITLKPIGEVFVIHGTINPFVDANGDGQLDPDFDTYTLTVTAPALVEISVDGVNGLLGAFYAQAGTNNPASAWSRYGLSVIGDTTKRQLYFPAAGEYQIAITDTRSLFGAGPNPPNPAGLGGSAGGPDAAYYVSISQIAIPAPTPITITAGVGSVTDKLGTDEIKFYTAAMGNGLNDAFVDMPQTQANGSLVTSDNGTFVAYNDETFDPQAGPIAAEVLFGNIAPTDTAVIAVDTSYNYGPAPADFTLHLRTTTAVALSLTGGSVSEAEPPASSPGITGFDQFYLDVAAAGEIDNMALSWNHGVDGALVDGAAHFVANFTFTPGGFVGNTFSSYHGLLRFPAAGRYYFIVYDPAGPNGNLVATSAINVVTPVAITEGTAHPGLSATTDRVLTYDAGTDVWQRFTATDAGTGALQLAFYNPGTTFGRLDPVTTTSGPATDDNAPIFTEAYTGAGGARGRILLDDPTTSYFVTTTAAIPAGTYGLDFDKRAFHDFGSIAAGASAMQSGDTLDAGTPTNLYLFRTQPGNPTTITVHPVTATLDTRFQQLDRDETLVGTPTNTGGAGADDTSGFIATSSWTAFEVGSATAVATPATYDVTVAVGTPVGYAITTGSTPFVDRCDGSSTPIVFIATDPGDGIPADDEGLSAPISTPTGFTFYGIEEPKLVVSTNGFSSFDTTLTDSAFLNTALPTSIPPNGLLAPYWTDLENVVACTRSVGSTLVIQWTGNLFGGGPSIQMQAILDPAANTVELVWGPNQQSTGDAGTVGIEDQAGANASSIGFNVANSIAPSTSALFTPM